MAICSAPQARVRVTVGRSASGTRATVTPTAKMSASETGFPTSSVIPKNSAPTPSEIAAMMRTTRCSCRVSGVGGLVEVPVSRVISPSRVAPATRVTWAVPPPSTTKQPAKTSAPSSTGTGSLSPVSIEVSSRSEVERRTTPSAGMRSPGSRTTTSSTTTSRASTTVGCPSRTTVARAGIRDRRRSAARSARPS